VKASHIRGGRGTTVELNLEPGTPIPGLQREAEVELLRAAGGLLIRWNGKVFDVRVEPARKPALARILDGGLPRICWIASYRPSTNRLSVQVVEFLRSLSLPSPVAFGVDEAILASLRKQHRLDGSMPEIVQWLEERLFLGPAGKRRTIVVPSRGQPLDAFQILGDRLSVAIRKDGDRYLVQRLLRGTPDGLQACVLDGEMTFGDATAAAAVSLGARTALEEAVRSRDSYLRIWSEYNKLEEDVALRRARTFGVVRYDRREQASNGGWTFSVERSPDLADRIADLDDDDRIEIEAAAEPQDLTSWESAHASGQQVRSFVAPLAFFDEARSRIELAGPQGDDEEDDQPAPPEQGWLFVCQRGDRTRLQRRENAEERIRLGRCPMPWIGLLLEGQPAPRPNWHRREGLSAAVRDAFGGSPTSAQEEALAVALNTPDIALIQGPPGTGKTKVITALQRRIAEVADKDEEVAHRILLSSAQHEAVENVVKRSSVFGLPPVKVGSRRHDTGDGIDPVERFRDELIERLQASAGPMPASERAPRARRAAVAVLKAPSSRVATAARLQEVEDAVGDLLSPRTAACLRERTRQLRSAGTLDGSDPEERALRRESARALRVMPGAFLDDGPLQAHKALRRLAQFLQPGERALLERCAAWSDTSNAPGFLAEVERLRNHLDDRLAETLPTEVLAIDAESASLLRQAIDELHEYRTQMLGTEEAIVASWLHDLEADQPGVRAVLEHYTAVLAATLQHSAARQMMRVRGITTGSATFDSVIVDEAARSHPLDQLIPMAMAKRRIVLVGDHRQLPHMLEPEIERELAARAQHGQSIHKETVSALRESLFQMLWGKLKKLEAADGIRRTATLDVQFRMHPVLGSFVSEAFYEVHGDPRIDSGLPATDFAHSLPGYLRDGVPAVAAWIDVPGERGAWEFSGRSKSRPVEATRLAGAVREVLDGDRSLSVGVIAFYQRQVEEIFVALGKLGLAEHDGRGWHVADPWKQTTNRKGERVEWLRVGTVDSFQGREFDVVFLSLTRSNDLPYSAELEHLRRKYGHLMLENRMCVAMSRQHRLLVCVGDLAFARTATPLRPLQSFVRLCEGDHGVLR